MAKSLLAFFTFLSVGLVLVSDDNESSCRLKSYFDRGTLSPFTSLSVSNNEFTIRDNAAFVPNVNIRSLAGLVSPPFQGPAGDNSQLVDKFSMRIDTELGNANVCYDGGVFVIAVGENTTFTPVNVTELPYNPMFTHPFEPAYGVGWCSPYVQNRTIEIEVPLGPLVPNDEWITLMWAFETDETEGGNGWWISQIEVNTFIDLCPEEDLDGTAVGMSPSLLLAFAFLLLLF